MFSYVSLEERVPPDHPLRAIRRITDRALALISPELGRLYLHFGRPSIPPERLLRALSSPDGRRGHGLRHARLRDEPARHPSYAVSQEQRKLVEQGFGWMKTIRRSAHTAPSRRALGGL